MDNRSLVHSVVLAVVILILTYTAAAGQAPPPPAPLPEAFRNVLPDDATMKFAREQIGKCWAAQKVDMLAMAQCSNHLVAQDELPACVATDIASPCLAVRLCKTGESPTAGCVVRPPWLDDPAHATAWRRMLRYEPPTIEQAVELNIPPSAEPWRVARCKDLKTDKEKGECLAKALISEEDREAFDCVKTNRGDVLDIALNCLGPRVKVTLSKGEKELARCVLSKTKEEEINSCLVGKVGNTRAAAISKCTFTARDPMELGACFKSLELSSSVREDADCFAAAKTTETIAKCASKHLKDKDLKRLEKDLQRVECLKRIKGPTTDAAILECAPGGQELYKEAKRGVDCALKAHDAFDDRLFECIQPSPEAKALVDCYKARHNDPAGMLACSAGEVLPKSGLERDAINCAANVVGKDEKDLVAVLAACSKTTNETLKMQQRVSACRKTYESVRTTTPEEVAKLGLAYCVGGGEHALKKAMPAVDCFLNANSKSALEWATGCAKYSPKLGGEVQHLADCYTKGSGDTLLVGLCLSKQKLNRDQARALRCLREETSNESRAVCMAGQYVDAKTSKLAACAVSGGGNAAATATCAAGVQLSFLKGLNPEWRTAVECAASTGGEPMSGASCIGTRLAIAEITKCLSGGIGTKGGCFGPNNTIVKFIREYYKPVEKLLKAVGKDKTVRNAIHDLTKGPGKNNEIRKALRNIDNDLKKGPGKNNEIRKALGNVGNDLTKGPGKNNEITKVANAILRPRIRIKF